MIETIVALILEFCISNLLETEFLASDEVFVYDL